jgi:uncharacterized radical SAM superfamily Fe-S cluster-containing enzyme
MSRKSVTKCAVCGRILEGTVVAIHGTLVCDKRCAIKGIMQSNDFYERLREFGLPDSKVLEIQTENTGYEYAEIIFDGESEEVKIEGGNVIC